ncbi:MAG: carboxypeptidase regulatory-like domain-containing protein [Candidatus Thiodiazotropha endolucinida]
MSFGIKKALVIFLCIFLTQTASASIPDGLNWLATHNNPDGSYGTGNDIATSVQTTAETLRAFSIAKVETAEVTTGYVFLSSESFYSTEYLSRKIIALVESGDDASSLLSELEGLQQLNGSFSELPGFNATVLDTAFAAEAFSVTGRTSSYQARLAVDYLYSQQNADGGWGQSALGPNSESSVYVTSLVLSAIALYRDLYNLESNISNAQNYLLNEKESDALWGETFVSAQALIALVGSLDELTPIADSLSRLRESQLSDGSWAGDVYTTALVLRALQLAASPPNAPALSSVIGTVVDADTQLPLEGISLTLSGTESQSTSTDVDGGFSFINLAAGAYSLDISHTDYATVTTNTSLSAGQLLDFGTIQMVKQAQASSGTIRGTITDTSSGSALAGVTITVSGVSGSVLTDSNGDFQIVNVQPGSVSVQATRSGYSTVTGSVDIVAGSIYIFSPALTPVDAPVTELRGTVTDGATGQPLVNVSVSVTGATTAMATTDAHGYYQITGLNPGNIAIEVSTTGYDSAVASTTVYENNILEFSPALYPTGTTPPEVNTAGVNGVVVDSTTEQLLGNVSVIATFGTQSQAITTNNDGRFEFTGIVESQGVLQFSLNGYQNSTIGLSLTPMATLDIGQIRLRPEETVELLPDLIVESIDPSGATTDMDTLEFTGSVSAIITNRGTASAPQAVTALAFYDNNNNGAYDAEVDILLGNTVTQTALNVGENEAVEIPVSGVLPYRDAHIKVWVDSLQSVIESNEQNNIGSIVDACQWRSSNLILNLEFEGDFNDSTGFNNHAAVDSRSQGIAQTVTDGLVGQALSLQDGLVWLRVADSPSLRTTEAITMSAWVSPTGQIGSNSGVFFKGELIGQQPDWQLNLNDIGTGGLPGSSGVSTSINGTGYASSEVVVVDFDFLNPIPMDAWTHVAVTYDRNELRLYINGTLVGTEPWSNPINTSGSDLYIGNRFRASGDVGGFQGLMDELRLYNVALSPDEISQLASRTNADLTASQISFFTRGDGSNQLTALIGNAGSVTTVSGTQISFYEGDPNAGGTLLGSVELPPLPGDSSQPVTLGDIPQLAGGLPLYVVADSGNIVSECNETNNVAWMAAPDLRPDLVVESVDTSGVATNLETLSVAGTATVVISNIGREAALDAAVITLFEDINNTGTYDAGIDHPLAEQSMPIGLAQDEILSVEMVISGSISFRDAPIHAMVDSNDGIVESNEGNNTNTSANQCVVLPDASAFEPVLKWSWNGSSVQPSYDQVLMAPVVVPLEDTNNDGLFDENDTPSIVFSTAYPENTNRRGYLRAVSGLDGRELWTASRMIHRAGSLAAGDIDGDGTIEIIAVRPGSTDTSLQSTGLIAFEHTGEVKWENTDTAGVNWGSASIADIDGDGVVEIIGGNTVLNADGSLRWQGTGYSGVKTSHVGQLSIVADINLDGAQEVVAGAAAYASDGTRLWQNTSVGDGYDGVGNFDVDDYAEIVVVAASRVALLEHTGDVIWGPVALPGGGSGGAPTIADVDGDGEPEIGVAGARFYTVFDTDGSILWSSSIQDVTSHVTGSSVFDFDGDGRVEVVYSDEQYLRVYNGTDGVVLFETPNNSVTTFELPVIVDIDNDDHAEIVVCSNNYYFAGSTGIQVYEDINDAWVDTRSIWNQHSYHITNVNDDGSIPANEQPSWLTHNSYRLNTFADPVATLFPDITASKLQVLDNGAAQPIAISIRIGNGGAGDLTREIAIAFYEGDPTSGGALLGTVSLSELTAGNYQDVTLNDVSALSGTADIYVIADYDNRLQECNEANNQVVLPVLPQTSNGAIGVATDVAIYGPDSPVQLMAVVTNTSVNPGEFRAELRVEDTQGTLIQSYPPRAVGPMAGGAAINLNDVWNTASYQAGTYRLHGLLTDLDGVLIDEAQSPFEIRHSADNLPLAALRTTTDLPIYHTSDTAQLNNLARNLSVNTQIRDAGLRIRVTNAAGDELFTHQQTLGELSSSAFLDTITPYSFTNAAEGIYTVTGELTDASGGLLATDQAQYEVVADLQKDMTGTVAAQLKIVQRGQTQTCTDTLTYTGNQALNGQLLRQLLVNLDSAETQTSNDITIDMSPGATESLIRSVATNDLSEGVYSCVLQAMITGEWITLGHDSFSLTVPPIVIDGTLEQATLPRLLVLLDENIPCSDNNDSDGGDDSDHDCCGNSIDRDPHGPSNAPLLSEQRSTLEALLTAQGYSYTIVSDKAAFAEQLLSGAYNTYALFSEQVKLSEAIQKVLREAVFRGEGLLVAGDHEHRNHNLYDALGVNYSGKRPDAHAVEMTDSDLSGPQELTLQLEEQVINAELSNATSAGHFLFSGNHTDTVHAVTINPYGEGRAVHVSYDLLAEATLAGLTGPHADLISSSLATITPEIDLPQLGSSIPILLTVTNQGMATPGQAVITLPQGVALIDSGTAMQQPNGSIVWPFILQESEASDLMLWLQPQSDQSDLRIDALIQTGEAPDFLDQETLSLTLMLSSAPRLTDLLNELSLLADQDDIYHNAFNYLEQAKQALDESDSDDALEKMLKSSDELIKLDIPEAGQIRLELAQVIRLTGLTLATDSEHHDDDHASDDDHESCHEDNHDDDD